MDTQTITAKWNTVGRVFLVSINIAVFIVFILIGFFSDYKQNGFNSRGQMVLLMTGFGTITSLIGAWLCLYAFLWKLEIKNEELIIFRFLKKPKAYKLSNLIVETNDKGSYIKHNGKTIARMSIIMIENCDEIVCAIESTKV